MVHRNLFSWKSKKQETITKCAETKYHAIAHGCCEQLWLRILLDDFVSSKVHLRPGRELEGAGARNFR